MYNSILVPLDGSPFSAKALPVAAAIAERSGATLHVVTVLDPSAYVPFVPGEVIVPVLDTEAMESRRLADEQAIKAEAAKLSERGIDAKGVLLEGTVVETLSEYAVANNVQLIVMTTHGRSGFQRIWLGSVATSFLQRAPCPVFMVRPTGARQLTEESPLPQGKMLVPLDGSPFSDAILPHAARFADSSGITPVLFTVSIPNAIPMAPFGTEAFLADEGDLSRQESEAQKRLKDLCAAMPSGTETLVETDMTAARAIIERAANSELGAIAMATHGRTGITKLVLGSVADAVLKSSDLPMLLYRPTATESQG